MRIAVVPRDTNVKWSATCFTVTARATDRRHGAASADECGICAHMHTTHTGLWRHMAQAWYFLEVYYLPQFFSLMYVSYLLSFFS